MWSQVSGHKTVMVAFSAQAGREAAPWPTGERNGVGAFNLPAEAATGITLTPSQVC